MFTLLFMCEIFIIIHILNFYLKYFPAEETSREEKTFKKRTKKHHTHGYYTF